MMMMVMVMLMMRLTRGLLGPLGLQAQRGPQAPLMMLDDADDVMMMMMGDDDADVYDADVL